MRLMMRVHHESTLWRAENRIGVGSGIHLVGDCRFPPRPHVGVLDYVSADIQHVLPCFWLLSHDGEVVCPGKQILD